MVDTTGQANLRAETISKVVNGFALQIRVKNIRNFLTKIQTHKK